MRYGKIIICLFTAVFLAAALYVGSLEPEPEPKSEIVFSVTLRFGGETEKIDCWENTKGEFYVFLPSYAELSDTFVSIDGKASVSINGQPVQNGTACSSLQLDTPYSFTYTTQTEDLDTTLTFHRSGNVPTMYIDVLSGNMDFIHAEKGNEEPGQLRLYSDQGDLEYAGQVSGLSGRGNATWLPDKKPYNLSLSYAANLLGMGAAQNWILLANAYDASNLRNKIVYDFAREIGMDYSPQCQWVDLYLNGSYAGLYLLSTRNEIHSQRVDISQTNSFLVSVELEGRLDKKTDSYVSTGNSSQLVYRIRNSSIEKATLQTMLQSAENAILAEDGVDPTTGKSYLELIDLDSWARRYLIDEVFCNYDGGTLSEYFYYDGSSGSGKIYAGPVWDMDNCLAQDWYPPNSIWAGRPHTWDDNMPSLFYCLWQKEEFRQRVLQLYEEEFRPGAEQLLHNRIEEYSKQIQQAAQVNAIRWNAEEDPSEQADYIRSYLEQRIEFLDEYYFGDTRYCIVQEAVPAGAWRCFAVAYGESLSWSYYYTDNDEGRYLGYYTVDTDEPFDINQPVYSDVAIYPKREFYEKQELYESEPVSDDQDSSIPLWTFAPLAGMLGMLMFFLLIDWIRTRRNGGRDRGRSRSREVSSRTEV
ncbi:MAG: CotH kinase family protein [Faecousia sp.]